MKVPASPEVTRLTLQVVSLGVIIGGALWILQPFIPSILWAAIIVITTWPLFLRLESRLWHKRWLAILVMIGALFLIVVIPCVLAIGSILSSTDQLTAWAKALQGMTLPSPPEFLMRIPMIGPRIIEAWQKARDLTSEEILHKLAPYTGVVLSWLVGKAGSIAMVFVQLLLTLIISALLYAKGELMVATIRAFARRLAGAQGEEVAILAGKAIRSVALGVVVTALVQALISGVGLAAAGVPSAALLTAIIFILCLAQIGPGLVLVPAVVWLYWKVGPGAGTILLVFSIVALPLDNLMRPILIKKGADMPLFLVFAGVIGGLVALGIIGLFIGPVILAVAHTLLKTWVKSSPATVAETVVAETVAQSR